MRNCFNRLIHMLPGALLAFMLCTPIAQAQVGNQKPFQAAEARVLGQLVYTDITTEFNNTELRTVMEFFKTYTGSAHDHPVDEGQQS